MNDITPVLSILTENDKNVLIDLIDELKTSWNKRQVFRTETEMRFSVLNDGNFPTNPSKYWQAVREQTVMLDNLVSLSFEIRRNDIKRKKLEQRLKNTYDNLEYDEIQIDIDETNWQRANMEQVAKDRVREILLWSQIKNELDDGTFDTKNVNTHQAESYKLALQNRLQTLTEGSSQAEVLNVIGPLNTLERLQQNGTLPKSNNIKQLT
jgi:hypothetical protein